MTLDFLREGRHWKTEMEGDEPTKKWRYKYMESEESNDPELDELLHRVDHRNTLIIIIVHFSDTDEKYI